MQRTTDTLFAVIACLGCATAQATPTRHSLDKQIRACFVDRGAHVKLTKEGGTAEWGKSGVHWAGWSYMRWQGRLAVIGAWNLNLTKQEKRAARFCTRWPR